MDFGEMKEKFKDSEDFTSALTTLEAEFTALSGKKETAVENEKNLRGTKQEIAKALGLEENTPATDIISKLAERLTGDKSKIDSFQKNASSKELEAAKFNEDFSSMQEKLNGLTKANEDQAAAIRLNDLKAEFGKALNDVNIKDASAQDLVFEGYLSKAGNVEDLNAFAKSIAESKPFLTQSIHKPGAGTRSAVGNTNSASLANTKIGDKAGRTAIINQRLQDQGLS